MQTKLINTRNAMRTLELFNHRRIKSHRDI